MIKKVLIFSILTLFCTIVFSQIVYKNKPPQSFKYKNAIDFNKETYHLPKIDIQKYIEEDGLQSKDIAQRFAAPIKVTINIENNGTWTTLPDGSKTWQLRIKSEDALNLNLQFNNFELPKGGELYIYSENKKDIRGPFTFKNNRPDKSFAVYLLQSNDVTLEYYQQKNTVGNPKIEINSVFHGYKSSQGFNDSGSCNNNVNCPEGLNWQNEKKSVALIITGGVSGIRWCSGAMVNNTREDGTPYFLTANHCLTGAENNWAFIYNYESPNCINIDGSLTESVLGATVVASDFESDFALLRLDNLPPVSYDVYHSGWDANDVGKDSVVGIHHPDGDIKKISFDFDSVKTNGYSSVGIDHWEVSNWDDGTTEPVSSGSPLFDKFHKIIGQLHGGFAACGNNLEDKYGKFSYSWDNGTTPNTRLKDWLDPDNTEILVLNGAYFNTPSDTTDMAIVFIEGVADRCDTLIADASVHIKNLGFDTINNLNIDVLLNNNSIQQINWIGNLAFTESEVVLIDSFFVTQGIHELKLIISNPNGKIDENKTNDTMISTFNAINGNKITINVNTDFFGYETGVILTNSNADTLYMNNGFPGSSSINIDNCLENDCYSVKITDSYGDGIDDGNMIYLQNNSSVFDSIDGVFGSEVTVDFCVCNNKIVSSIDSLNCNKITAIEKNITYSSIKINPNPSNGEIHITSQSIINEVSVFDLLGKEILSIKNILSYSKKISLSGEPKGLYFVHIKSNTGSSISKLILK